MEKAFDNFTWKNLPSTDTPINATNLNKLNNAIDTIDDRVIAMQVVSIAQTGITIGTSQDTTVTFSNSAITTDAAIDVYTTVDGLDYSSMTTTTGQCQIVFAQRETALTGVGVKIYIRN